MRRPPPSVAMLHLALALSAQVPLQFPHVEVRGAEGFEFASLITRPSELLVLPTVTTSERVPCLVPGPRGLRVRIASPRGVACTLEAVSLSFVEHDAAELLLHEGESVLRLGQEELPRWVRARGVGDALPRLARFDGQTIETDELEIAPCSASGKRLVLRFEDSSEATARGSEYSGPTAAFLPELEPDSVVLRGPMRALDQLFYATVVAVAPEELGSCSLEKSWAWLDMPSHLSRRLGRGAAQALCDPSGATARPLERLELPRRIDGDEALELRFMAPPPPPEGRVHTFLLEVELRSSRDQETPAATPRERDSWFVDQAPRLGLDTVHFEGPADQRDIRPTMGPGAAWGDVDGDGWQDLLLVQGSGREGCDRPVNRLYRNTGGAFEELQALDDGAGMGALFFDLEGDGDLDLYQANYGADRLYANDGSGHLEDVSEVHGIGGDLWSAGLCAGDVDGDGDLDLYVTSYLDYDLEKLPPVAELAGMRREDPVEMLPFAFPGQRNVFYENRAGRLVDVTEERGLLDVQGRGMQAVFWDFDRDRDLDLYIANDVSFNVLFQNDGKGHFEDISFQTGMDDPRGGMGVALGDVDGDGDEDLFLTNWQLEANALYLNHHVSTSERRVHVGTFQDATVRSRLGPAGVGVTSWGAVLFDADNDGDLDLFVPNGYTSPDYSSTGVCVGQPNQFFLNDGEGRFEDASERAGEDVTCHLASRSAAVCDYDRDGRLDLFITNNNGPYQLLRNEHPTAGHWLGLQLRMEGPNPFAVGARVELEAGDLFLTRTLTLGEGYLAGHAAELHFGLGQATEVDALRVYWPDGRTTEHQVEGVDRWTTLSAPN